VGYATTNSFYQ